LTSENLMRNKNQQRIAITLRKKTIMWKVKPSNRFANRPRYLTWWTSSH
jgi:hypothetical protein